MKSLLAIGVCLLGAALPAAAQTAEADKPTLTCANGLCRLDVVFPAADATKVRIDDAFVAAQKGTRITEKTTLRIRIGRPNLLRYAVQFDTKETVIESYVYLEKLWKQVIGLGRLNVDSLLAPASTERSKEQAFVDAVNAWRDAIDKEVADLTTFVAPFTALTLTDTQVSQIKARAGETPKRLADLDKLRVAAKAAMSRVEHFAIYDATIVTQTAAADRLDAFSVLATQIVNGLDRRIAFGPAGRVVVVTITAKDRGDGQDARQSVEVEFFVHSTLPVTFHAGYTVRSLKEQDFETVASSLQTAAGADLFSKVQDSAANGTFTAFMSYRLCDVSRARRCPQLTIGTDFKDVGERLYGGVSWPLGRAFLTAGVVSGETKEGEGPVSDALGAAGQVTGARELFTAIATKRKWGAFIGISFAPF